MLCIEDPAIVQKILKHLGLWEIKQRPPRKSNGQPKAPEYSIYYTDSQLPVSDNFLYAEGHVFSVMDPIYPEASLY